MSTVFSKFFSKVHRRRVFSARFYILPSLKNPFVKPFSQCPPLLEHLLLTCKKAFENMEILPFSKAFYYILLIIL
jgi:hypothetical protein